MPLVGGNKIYQRIQKNATMNKDYFRSFGSQCSPIKIQSLVSCICLRTYVYSIFGVSFIDYFYINKNICLRKAP